MIDREEMTDVAFEMLKLLFFVVTYFLIVNDIDKSIVRDILSEIFSKSPDADKLEKLAPFYNTLFIFSATTWIDYLSAMKDSIRDGYNYDGKYRVSPSIGVMGASIGFVTTFISLMCVFFKTYPSYCSWGAAVYWVSLFFLGMKSFVVSDMILHIKKDWSRDSSRLNLIPISVIILVLVGIIVFSIIKNGETKLQLLFLLMFHKGLIPCVVILSLSIGILIGLIINIFGGVKDNYSTLEYKHQPQKKNILDDLEEQSYLEIQNETDGKIPYDDLAFDWIVGNERSILEQKEKREKSKADEN